MVEETLNIKKRIETIKRSVEERDTCINCKYFTKDNKDYPCVECTHAYIDKFVRADVSNKEMLLKEISTLKPCRNMSVDEVLKHLELVIMDMEEI